LDESFDSSPQAIEPAESPEPERRAFPWPPRPGTGVLTAFVDTWVESVFRPSSFFASMPREGFWSALAYYLPIAVIGSALMLFWRAVAVAAGYADVVAVFGGQPFDPVTELIGFLFSPLTATLYLLIGAGIAHIGLKMVGAAHENYMATVRVSAFAAGPVLFIAVPLVGIPASFVWVLVLTVVGLREVHRASTGRVIAALVLPIVLIIVLATIVILAGVLSLIAVGKP